MSIFKENDIRGLYPEKWNRETAYQIGNCIPDIIDGRNFVIGRDGRKSSNEILEYLTRGLEDRGIDVTDIGQVDTPAVYFTNGRYKFDCSIMITASHNPVGYNGLKITGKNAAPVEYTSGLKVLEDLVKNKKNTIALEKGSRKFLNINTDYVNYIKSFQSGKRKIKAVFDCSNGAAGRFVTSILNDFSGEAKIINGVIDGSFPNHGPNPVLFENLVQLKNTMDETDADIGFCFDGDGDRVVMVDSSGRILSPDFITAIIGLYYFKYHPEKIKGNKTVLVDIRSSNSVSKFLSDIGADVNTCPVGHAKIKKLMREHKALFAGELTGHYYYRENYYSDSAWISIFRVLSVLSEGSKNLTELESEIMQYYFSGELSFKADDKDSIIRFLLNKYGDAEINRLDGYRFNYNDWWFIIRKSGTEPLLRLVVEAETEDLMIKKVKEISEMIKG